MFDLRGQQLTIENYNRLSLKVLVYKIRPLAIAVSSITNVSTYYTH